MPVATVHIPDVGGFAGIARCFRLSQPYDGHDYVTIWAQPSFSDATGPEVVIVPAVETGAAAELWLKRRPGSFVMHDEPVVRDEHGQWRVVEDKLAGAYWLALTMLGYTLVDAEPQPAQDAAESAEQAS